MRNVVGYVENVPIAEAQNIPFQIYPSYQEAAQQLGLEGGSRALAKTGADLRSRIQIENDFTAHVMQISFAAETVFESKEDVDILKSKIKNILKMWHTPYSLLFDCSQCSFSAEAKQEFGSLERFLKAFFCKKIVGFAPKEPKESYPFPMFRVKHLAAAALENEGLASGAVANCSTRAKHFPQGDGSKSAPRPPSL